MYLHSCGVIWGDLSTRNALIDEEENIRLCDFASSTLADVYPQLGDFTYEITYCPAVPEDDLEKVSPMQRELYALGSAIYEIVEWRRPYSEAANRFEVYEIFEGGGMPEISDDNIARVIIRRCWDFKYESAQAVVEDLKALHWMTREKWISEKREVWGGAKEERKRLECLRAKYAI